MPGLGAAVEEGGNSHCNLAGSACLGDASSCVNQKTAAVKMKMAELALNHGINFILEKA